MWERNSALDLLFSLPVGLVTVDLHLSAYKASPIIFFKIWYQLAVCMLPQWRVCL
uniref:Uncharacterized protein n=1 Tax=Anguilla anguilla TaxID=7936 RepID=A0A0E9SIS2_ANGAN